MFYSFFFVLVLHDIVFLSTMQQIFLFFMLSLFRFISLSRLKFPIHITCHPSIHHTLNYSLRVLRSFFSKCFVSKPLQVFFSPPYHVH